MKNARASLFKSHFPEDYVVPTHVNNNIIEQNNYSNVYLQAIGINL